VHYIEVGTADFVAAFRYFPRCTLGTGDRPFRTGCWLTQQEAGASCAWAWLFQHPPRRSECTIAGQLFIALAILLLLYEHCDADNASNQTESKHLCIFRLQCFETVGVSWESTMHVKTPLQQAPTAITMRITKWPYINVPNDQYNGDGVIVMSPSPRRRHYALRPPSVCLSR